jgi:hypothetical protein
MTNETETRGSAIADDSQQRFQKLTDEPPFEESLAPSQNHKGHIRANYNPEVGMMQPIREVDEESKHQLEESYLNNEDISKYDSELRLS